MVEQELICLECYSDNLTITDSEIVCNNCGYSYPVVEGIPVVIHESKSIFKHTDFIEGKDLFFNLSKKSSFFDKISKLIPGNDVNWVSGSNVKYLLSELEKLSAKTPRVLILGGSIVGNGLKELVEEPSIEVVESDVSFGPRTKVILDCHDIPYQDGSFDLVVIQAVLEHIVDPHKCVNEIERVLRNNGLVYAETPFMQQVHGGKFDFTRFTYSGHRLLLSCSMRKKVELFQGLEQLCSGVMSTFYWHYLA